ncbi:MAG: hypothetical protein V1862_12205 [Methanobacteriota archaeon]
MQSGQILSTKQVGEDGTRSRSMINGIGQVSLRAQIRGNNTSENSRTYADGLIPPGKIGLGPDLSRLLVIASPLTGVVTIYTL